jgi:hypothetical protein
MRSKTSAENVEQATIIHLRPGREEKDGVESSGEIGDERHK